MNTPFGIKEKNCRKSDYDFVFDLTKKTLWSHISKYVVPSKEIFDEGFNKDYKSIKILSKGKRKIGLYQLDKKGNKLELVKLYLIAAYQNKGIGSFFMDYWETLGAKKLSLQVWDNNKNAIRLYKRKGFKIKNKKAHKIFMEKRIE